ncbi:UPF0235 protein C15orf40 homolog [Parasteatoda tepidariorum]|uniref:UPF0235 protein C15orf40 homolog n=1 Tax=Parasteatoda tepidariorum TaxID=114398 RepID=UPI00077F8A0B|nr:UPF0235 protein C15orf40 homolog [Parasteatoda tepidariorum]
MSFLSKRVLKSIKFTNSALISSHAKMPKTKKIASEGKKKIISEKEDNCTSKNGAVFLNNKSEIILKVHAKPGAKESAITDISDESIGVQIAAPPVDGEANKELIRYLAEVLQLRKSDVNLEKGSRSKEKTVVVSDSSLENVLSKLTAASRQ